MHVNLAMLERHTTLQQADVRFKRSPALAIKSTAKLKEDVLIAKMDTPVTTPRELANSNNKIAEQTVKSNYFREIATDANHVEQDRPMTQLTTNVSLKYLIVTVAAMLSGIESVKSVRHADLEKLVTTVTRDARLTETTEPAPMSNTEVKVAMLEAKSC
jgi:hypothetical protein